MDFNCPSRVLLFAGLTFSFSLGALPVLRGAEVSASVPSGGSAETAAQAPASKPLETPKTEEMSVDAQRANTLFWEALRCLRSHEETTRERGREQLVEAASLEHLQAQDYLGQSYLGGKNGFPKDLTKGVNWLRLASENGLAFSKLGLAACLLEGVGVRKDLKEAERLLQEALAPAANYSLQRPPEKLQGTSVSLEEGESTVLGSIPVSPEDRARAQARFLLGEIYSAQGKHTQAQAEYLLAAKQGDNGRAGHYKACLKAALNYAYGRGVPRDSRKAGELVEISRQLFKRLGSAYARSLVDSKEVDSFAQADVEDQLQRQVKEDERRFAMEVAASLSDKKSKNYDIAEAFRWLELSVEDGQSWAMNALGLLYLDTKAGRVNAVKARELFKAAAEKDGDTLAWGNYAICLQQGIGGPKDPEAAMGIFKRYHTGDIVCRLGFLGRCPNEPMSYDSRVKLTLKLAEKEDSQALYLIGCAFVYGRNDKLRMAGFTFLKKAADLGNGEALSQLGTLHLGMAKTMRGEQAAENLRLGLSYIKKGADKGSVSGLINLGLCYQDGVGVLKDEEEAMRLYDLALQREPGQAIALNNISQLYFSRYAEAAMRLDEEAMKTMQGKMVSFLEAADQKGLVLAAKNLAGLYYEGHLGKKDYQQAYRHFDDAANRGDIHSRRMLGVMLERGEGVPVSYAEAAYHYRIAALAGDRYALEQLCRFYRAGLGVSRDPERALYWLKLSLKQGNGMARLQIVDILLERGEAEAAWKVLDASTRTEFSHKPFQSGYNHRMGRMYERGLGVPVDEEKGRQLRASALAMNDPEELFLRAKEVQEEGKDEEAVVFLNKALRAGHREAGFVLAQCHEEGRGVKKNAQFAAVLYGRASDNGHRLAKLSLARLSLQGVSSAPNLVQALKLCTEAEEAGVAGAADLRVQLEERQAALKSAQGPGI